jgi:hypothetical protein
MCTQYVFFTTIVSQSIRVRTAFIGEIDDDERESSTTFFTFAYNWEVCRSQTHNSSAFRALNLRYQKQSPEPTCRL